MFNVVNFTKNLFKTLTSVSGTISVNAHSKEKEWGLPLVRVGQGISERDIYDMSQIEKNGGCDGL